MFTANLSVTIKRLTIYKQKLVLAVILEGSSMPSNMAANTKHTTLLKNQRVLTNVDFLCIIVQELLVFLTSLGFISTIF